MFEWSSTLRSQIRTCSSILQRRLAGLGGAGSGSFARVGCRQNRNIDLLTPSRYWLTEFVLVRKRNVWIVGLALPNLRLHRLHAMHLASSGNLISILQVQINRKKVSWHTKASHPHITCPTSVRFEVIQINLHVSKKRGAQVVKS